MEINKPGMDEIQLANSRDQSWLEATRISVSANRASNPCKKTNPSEQCPLASVIVLNFNGEEIIEKCLDHLANQTYPNFEIIVVDNGSSDKSLFLLERYVDERLITLVKNETNLGVAGGRNRGMSQAKGEIIAFIDNDGYAEKRWLQNATLKLLSKPDIGAVSSLVFFDKNKIILNGAGGRFNREGYAQDHCFNMPFEFAKLPHDVLYPMGCGMVLRREVADLVGEIDRKLKNYFDDVEVGIRVWRCGFRVVLCSNAWVDHDFSYSDKFNKNKTLLYERGRIRNIIKYFPALLSPRRVFWELKTALRYLKKPGVRTLPFQVWGWNMWHFRSAWGIRRKFSKRNSREWDQIEPLPYFPAVPNNHSFSPNPPDSSDHLLIGRNNDQNSLLFGWHNVNTENKQSFRWTSKAASLLIRLPNNCDSLHLKLKGSRNEQSVTLLLRHLGHARDTWSQTIQVPNQWCDRYVQLELPQDVYELLMLVEPGIEGAAGSVYGIAVAEVTAICDQTDSL